MNAADKQKLKDVILTLNKRTHFDGFLLISEKLASAYITALGPNCINLPSDLIAQRAVGTAALLVLHAESPADLWPDEEPLTNPPEGVQDGDVGVAVSQSLPPVPLPTCSLCSGTGHERSDCPHDGMPGHGAG